MSEPPPAGPYRIPPRQPVVQPWDRLRSILAVRLDAAGDVLMTGPALRALRATNPDRLTLLTSSSGAAIAKLLPEVDDVIVYDAPWMKATAIHDPARDMAVIDLLRDQHFAGAVIFTVHSQSPLPAALMAYLAGIHRRLAHCRENPYQLLTDWVPDPEADQPRRHEVHRQLDLLDAVGIRAEDPHLALRVPDVASRSMRARLEAIGIGPRDPWLIVHPGATAPSRRYPPDGFGAVIRDVHARTGWPIVLTGDASEAGLVDEVRSAAEGIGHSFAGLLGIDELAAAISVAPMLLTNNTMPAHIAAAVGTPVVDLYALTNLQHTPLGVPNRVLSVDVPCKGCRRSECPLGHNRCLRGVLPSEIVEAILDLAREVGIPLTATTGSDAAASRVKGDAILATPRR